MSRCEETLSIGPPAPSSDTRSIATTLPPGSMRILVAEDNPINQQVITAQLKLLGVSAEVVGDGQAALVRWREGAFPLLLTDLQMPLMDGYQLAASIRREEKPPARMPIIALTANALKDESNRCKAAGMDDYLTKPVALTALEAVFERWLGRIRAVPARAPVTRPPERHRSQPAQVAREPVQAGVLARLVGDDPVELHAFFTDFGTSAARSATEIALAMENGQRSEAGFLAHRLKASARAVGALRLGNLCAHIESAAGSADDAALVAPLVLFQDEVVAVRQWIATHCGQQVAARNDQTAR